MSMPLIDPRTVLLLTSFMSLLMALVHFSIKRSYPAFVRVPHEWTVSMLIFIAGGFLASSAGRLPLVFSVVAANMALWLALYFAYVGSQRFFGVEPKLRAWLGVLSAALALCIWFTWFEPDYLMRLRLATLLMAALCGAHAWLVLRQGLNTFAKGAAFFTLLLSAINQLARTVSAFGATPSTNVLDTSFHHQFYMVACILGFMLISLCTVLMAADRLADELKQLAAHDPLTGALTRRHMDEVCQAELDRSRRHGRSMALLMMDLDNFKAINDTYGHQIGDAVLVDFVSVTRQQLRPADALGRFGGEEFVALLPETDLAQAQLVAERIRSRCEQSSSETAHTVSIGLAVSVASSEMVQDILKRADAALYRAKARGRNLVEAG
jgi:diguanylate cyclase (GGDEF)-like protein